MPLFLNFVVTGFGPFQNAPTNPTSIIADQLIAYLQEQQPDQQERKQSLAGRTRATILEVAVDAVQKFVNELFEELEQEQRQRHVQLDDHHNNNHHDHHNPMIVLLHLGVKYRGTGFQLEQCAYNDASFRIPDQRGYQPHKERIVAGMEWNRALQTPLQLEGLCQTLQDKFGTTTTCTTSSSSSQNGHLSAAVAVGQDDGTDSRTTATAIKIIRSTDPGRYVCNYTYCYSLNKFCHAETSSLPSPPQPKPRQQSSNTNAGGADDVVGPSRRKVWPLFLHVPPFDVIPEHIQMKFVAELMMLIEDAIIVQEEGE